MPVENIVTALGCLAEEKTVLEARLEQITRAISALSNGEETTPARMPKARMPKAKSGVPTYWPRSFSLRKALADVVETEKGGLSQTQLHERIVAKLRDAGHLTGAPSDDMLRCIDASTYGATYVGAIARRNNRFFPIGVEKPKRNRYWPRSYSMSKQISEAVMQYSGMTMIGLTDLMVSRLRSAGHAKDIIDVHLRIAIGKVISAMLSSGCVERNGDLIVPVKG